MLNIFCFQPYTCILQTGVDVMVRDQGCHDSYQVPVFIEFPTPTPMDQDLFLPLIPMSRLVDALLDYDNKQLLELVATSQVEYHLWLSCRGMSRT